MLWWWGDPWTVGHWVGFGFTAVFWIAVIVGVVYLIRHAASRSSSHGQQQTSGTAQPQARGAGAGEGPTDGATGGTALRILEERYARGEIDREEFLQRKADLTS